MDNKFQRHSVNAECLFRISYSPSGEDADIVVPLLIPVPVVAVETTVIPVEVEAVAVRVANMPFAVQITTR